MIHYHFSIILPVFNAVDTIERTLQSLVNQTYQAFQVIVIDGGSTDGTYEILKQYESKLAHLASKPDKGTTDAFNQGLDLAQGEIVGFLNADDWYELDALEKVNAAFNQNDTVDLVGGSVATHNLMGPISWVAPLAPERWSEECFLQLPVPHIATFIKKTLQEKVGHFNLSYKVASDQDFFVRLMRARPTTLVINDILGHVHQGGRADSYRGLSEKWLIASYYKQPMIKKNLRFLRYFSLLTLGRIVRFLGWQRPFARLMKYLGSRHGGA